MHKRTTCQFSSEESSHQQKLSTKGGSEVHTGKVHPEAN